MGMVLLLIVISGIFLLIFILSGKSASKNAALDGEIKCLREKILVVTSGDIQSRKIKDVIGNVTGISATAASTDRGFRKAEKEALADIMCQGIQMGANAIIDLKMTTGSYEQQGSQWMVSKVVYYGTAVKV